MLYLAFLWHHHQPYYRDALTGRTALPWARLHAVKDYYGMARIISEFPGVQATFNIVPSLAEQIQRYAEEGATDAWLEVTVPEVRKLSEADRERLLGLGFYANPRTMIGAFPRYQELFRKKLVGARFSARELLDLQVLSNLAWFHKTLLDDDPLLANLRRKGRDFAEDQKAALLAKGREVAGQVLPLYRKLEEAGQIEITTSPYFHPILPLLCDFRSAFEAMPWLAPKLGFAPVSLEEDAVVQVERAIALHRNVFGRAPRGMWPPEGSVSEAIVPIAAARGIRWIATDEEILAHSLGKPIHRDEQGNVLDGDVLYRPWRVRVGEAELGIVFRDHRLSDLFGFHYHRDPHGAVADFTRRLGRIRDLSRGEDRLVAVILDGENAWEHYPDGGVPFLRELYGTIQSLEWVRTVKIGDYLEAHPPAAALPRLYPGSWIDHNFYIWIGHEEDRAAWRQLLEARGVLKDLEARGQLSPEARAAAFEEIYVAEGSDWYWWYGDDHTSGMDDLYDAIYRQHLKNVYRIIGRPHPPVLEEPISKKRAEPPYEKPRALLDVKIDGRRTSFFEWLGAGRFSAEREPATMERAQSGPIRDMAFGFDRERFLLLLDFEGRPNRIFEEGGTVRVVFLQPQERDLVVLGPGRMTIGPRELTSVAVGEILELALPWKELEAAPGQEVRFYVEVCRKGMHPERAPRTFALRLEVPGEDFELREWAV